MKITIKHYPVTMSFETCYPGIDLPPMDKEQGICTVRTEIFRLQMRLQKIDHGTHHDVDDFVVEQVRKTRLGEEWLIGS